MHAVATSFSLQNAWNTLRRAAWARGVSTAGAAVWLLACSPALDWRQAQIDGPGLAAMFPCRPVGQSRQIELAGAAVTMKMQACEAGGGTFAVSVADVKDPAAVGPALSALRDASLGKLASPTVTAPPTGWGLIGATPQQAAGRWQLNSQRPDGSPLSLDTAVFARGTWVIQATVIGTRADERASTPFFDGLRFAP